MGGRTYGFWFSCSVVAFSAMAGVLGLATHSVSSVTLIALQSCSSVPFGVTTHVMSSFGIKLKMVLKQHACSVTVVAVYKDYFCSYKKFLRKTFS